MLPPTQLSQRRICFNCIVSRSRVPCQPLVNHLLESCRRWRAGPVLEGSAIVDRAGDACGAGVECSSSGVPAQSGLGVDRGSSAARGGSREVLGRNATGCAQPVSEKAVPWRMSSWAQCSEGTGGVRRRRRPEARRWSCRIDRAVRFALPTRSGRGCSRIPIGSALALTG